MTTPSPYLHQHHTLDPPAIDALAFRTYWSIRSRLCQLLLDGAISWQAYHAGVAFRTAAEIVLSETWRTQWAAERRHPGRFGVSVGRRVDAATKLRTIRHALGDRNFNLLHLHLVDDLSWSKLGRRYHVHAKTIRNWTIAALNALEAE
jgi:hypothetical protein